jgi:hypothetical protein
MMISAQAASSQLAAQHQNDLATVRAALENKVVAERLAQLGLSRDEANRRLAQLNPDRLHQVALHIDKERAAGSDVGLIAIVLGVLLLLVLLVSVGDDDDDDHHHDHHDDVEGGGAQTIIVK